MTRNRTNPSDVDYKYLKQRPKQKPRFRQHHIRAAGIIATAAMLMAAFATASWLKPTPIQTIVQMPVPDLSSENKISVAKQSEADWLQIKVKRGDTLSKLLRRQDIQAGEIHQLMTLGKPVRDLRRIKPGQTISIQMSDDRRLTHLSYALDQARTLLINKTDQGQFQAEIVKKTFEIRLAYASATITSSLFEAGQNENLSVKLIMELAHIFGWDIDFALDIRSGDKFHMLYEQVYHRGEKVRDGNIIAVEFTNRNKTYQAVRFTNVKGKGQYYSPEGRSMRKAFLRTPVKFSRISSRFSRARFHPVLNRMRAHHGVDYAARHGTPIRSTGDGKVIYRGRKGGYGKTVIIQHANRYTTLYAHMSRYNRRASSGSRVRQGQIIGYIGSTGLTTGPHLHYEFRVRGRHRDPLRIKFPKATPIAKQYREAFSEQTEPLLAQLLHIKRNTVAWKQ